MGARAGAYQVFWWKNNRPKQESLTAMKTNIEVIIGIFALLLSSTRSLQAQIAVAETDEIQLVSHTSVPHSGTFWMAKGPNGHPMPPYPGLPPGCSNFPIYALGNGQFVVDDSKGALTPPLAGSSTLNATSYLETRITQVRNMVAQAEEAKQEAQMETMAKMLMGDSEAPQKNIFSPDNAGSPGAICLSIEQRDGDAKYIYFNTQTGLVYTIEESTNLFDWSVLQTIVANDTNYAFYAFDLGSRFFRVVQPQDQIQFPNWNDFIEEFAYFDVSTSIQGNYHLELYGDGALLYQTTAAVPASGNFGVYDGSYNPNQWPYAPEYAFNDWELHVSATPAGASSASAQAVVTKKQRRRNRDRTGITIQMYNAFAISYLIQDEIDMYMELYFLANYNASHQVGLNGNILAQGTGRQGLPRLIDAGSWSQLKSRLYGASGLLVSDMHYFGHGGRTGLGTDLRDHTTSLSLAELQNDLMKTNPMFYVALDGCNTAGGSWWWQKADLLKAFVGFDKKIPKTEFLYNGWRPRFGWGWTDSKGAAYLFQGTLKEAHFDFVMDFYNRLTHRDDNGFLDKTYEDAIHFGQHPNGQGFNDQYHIRTDNSEGNPIDYVGCYDCFFDEGR